MSCRYGCTVPGLRHLGPQPNVDYRLTQLLTVLTLQIILAELDYILPDLNV